FGLPAQGYVQGRWTFRAWQRDTGALLEQVASIDLHEPSPDNLGRFLHPATGRALILTRDDARVVELGRRRTVSQPWKHGGLWFARLSPDGRFAITVDGSATARVRDLTTGKDHVFPLYPTRPLDAAFP